MKKNFLLSMLVMLMTSISSFAQKEYNMVITLNNGTTVTLGHNDIKEISFNDGAVSISGNMINTIDSLAGVTRGLKDGISNLEEELTKTGTDQTESTERLQQQMSEQQEQIASLMKAVESLNADIANGQATDQEQAQMQAEMNAKNAAMQDIIAAMQNQIAAMQNQIANMQAAIESQQVWLGNLMKYSETNRTDSEQLKGQIADLQKQIDELKQ